MNNEALALKNALLESLTGKVVAYQVPLAHSCGGAIAALFLSQLLYWTGKGGDEDGWIYKTINDWTEETGLTYSEQRTARKRLKAFDVMQEELRGIPAQLYFRINFDVLYQRLSGEIPEELRVALHKQRERDAQGRFTDLPVRCTQTGGDNDTTVFHNVENKASTNTQTGSPHSIKHNIEPETTTETTQRDSAAKNAAPAAVQDTAKAQPTFLSEQHTTDIVTPEDKLLFEAINAIRRERKHRQLKRYSNTTQKDAWRQVVTKCENIHNGRHMTVLEEYVRLGIVKNITGLPNLIRWVGGCVDNDAKDAKDTGWAIPGGAIR